MNYSVVLSRRAQKELALIDQPYREAIIGALRNLGVEPHPVGSRKLKNRIGYRIRVNDYRVLYDVDDVVKIVSVYKIGHRKEVYR